MDGSMTTGDDILAKICADTLASVATRKASHSLDDVKGLAKEAGKPRGFGRALMDATAAGRPGLITEIKKASPSGGLIREDFDPQSIAMAYMEGGAVCLSVLTDKKYFQGSPAHLQTARAAVKLPVIRKDFILDPWQVYESRAMGADCILLIMAALSDSQARDLEELARSLDMDVLAEVHDEAELDRALGLQTPLLGINNRNLKTMVTTLETTERLSKLVPPDRFLVSESGIKTNDDIKRLQNVCVQGFLVGESLMRQPDVKLAVQQLLGTN
ncbi:MAG: indole-3-glycerol phosphate synthase [Acidocella sp. 20-57-95]|nr:MAG: indole-3-glycerol phosphate synthase [Acidocella sp. 20-57-95]OYV61766.1 MAG: indole-3-glycerol phosphate synthase [Acidocella sp. 21-58-7]HQT65486.1 indole-3-glycerol phosphate synthase TrpC [Acidocella sp.]HQU03441.1 indole-3-glycerol phosphate synthase TrpC [Acidocella sp.]